MFVFNENNFHRERKNSHAADSLRHEEKVKTKIWILLYLSKLTMHFLEKHVF